MTQFYKQDLSNALDKFALSEEDLQQKVLGAKERIEHFITEIEQGDRPAFGVLLQDNDMAELEELNKKFHHEHIVVLGMGGSSLCGQTLLNFKGLFGQHHQRVQFVDNVDPQSVATLIQDLPLEKTCFLVVSKSGGTLETLLLLMLFVDALKAQNLSLKNHIVGITEPSGNALRQFLEAEDVPVFDHDPQVGGRFSVFSVVGGLPAVLGGVDVAKVYEGARRVLKDFLDNPFSCAPAMGAAFSVMALEQGKNIQVMFPYSDRLRKFSDWYVQLWAESIGKDGQGSTPVPAVGSTDQHSFLQLMMAGPNDKVMNIINIEPSSELKVSAEIADVLGQSYLKGVPVGEVLHTQAVGTADALQEAGRIVRRFSTPPLDEHVLGALMMHFMLETAIACFILDVDPWEQEDVEDGKKRTKAYLQQL